MRAGLLIAVVVLTALSLWTWPAKSTSGGPILEGAEAPANVRVILERSCQDCHSDRTRYPWYSYVAPVSLLIRSDVNSGRARLNFSRWGEYSLTRRLRFLSEIANQVQDREMPLRVYTLIHRDARLSDTEIAAVFRWTQSERLRELTEPRP